MKKADTPILHIENLTVEFLDDAQKPFYVLSDVSLTVERGEIVGLIGESGAGKTVLAHALMGLLDGYPGITKGKIFIENTNLLEGLPADNGDRENITWLKKFRLWRKKHGRMLNEIRGRNVGMIFQEPFKSMDPLFTVRDHICESLKKNKTISDKDIDTRVLEWLKTVQLDNPDKVQNQYVFELCGGEIQRVMIAVALSSKPSLVIADEPTTSVDTVTQKKILDLIFRKSRKYGQSLLFITHDLGIATSYFDRIYVIFGGQIVEIVDGKKIINNKFIHPYTELLLKAAIGMSDDVSYESKHISRETPGCIYASRCEFQQNNDKRNCAQCNPFLTEVEKNHFIRCWKYI